MLGLSENIQGIQVYVGEFTELVRDHASGRPSITKSIR